MKIRDENMNFVKSKTDLFRLIDNEAQTSTSKVVLFLILGTIFLDAYDITILGTMTDQLTQQFHLSPATLSIVMTSLPIGALFGALLGGTLAYQFGRKRILSIALLTLTVTSVSYTHLTLPTICSV